MALGQGIGLEGDVEVGSGTHGDDYMFVNDAAKGASVIEIESESWSRHDKSTPNQRELFHVGYRMERVFLSSTGASPGQKC